MVYLLIVINAAGKWAVARTGRAFIAELLCLISLSPGICVKRLCNAFAIATNLYVDELARIGQKVNIKSCKYLDLSLIMERLDSSLVARNFSNPRS